MLPIHLNCFSRQARSLAASAACGLALALSTTSSHAALVARDLTGDNVPDAYYDTLLNVSWYASANTLLANATAARTWAANLTVGTASSWRLPNVLPLNGVAYNHDLTNDGSSDRGTAPTGVGWGLASEMGHLFYVTLQNIGLWIVNPANPNAYVTNPAWDPAAHNLGPMGLVSSNTPYYAEQDTTPPGVYPWAFDVRSGFQFAVDEGTPAGYALAVHPGDVGNFSGPGPGAQEVPLPGTLLLSTAALLGLARGWRPASARRDRSVPLGMSVRF